jgi:hypothetical protein
MNPTPVTNTTTTTTTSAGRRRRRRLATVLAVGAGLLVIGACTEEQRRDLGEIDVRDELHSRVEQAVEDGGQTINGDLECESAIDEDGQVAASCVGVTDGGDDVTGSFTGTADVDDERCEAALAITVGGEAVVTRPTASCFNP